MIKLLILIMLALPARADVVLPTVSPANFSVGRTWIWDYFDQTGAVYSTERYQVISQAGSVVVIEMASDFGGGQNLKPSHRIEVDISKCLRAYHTNVKQPWSIKMFYLVKGVWTEIDQPNTLAFEEKFNCNPREFLSRGAQYLTVYSSVSGEPVFQQKLWGKLDGSWFSQSGTRAGVALRKDFSSDPSMAYWFLLRP